MKESDHFLLMLQERLINRDWVLRTLENPDGMEQHADGTKHFIKKIFEKDNRWLRVIVNISVIPNVYVTVFFDRRLRRENENRIR